MIKLNITQIKISEKQIMICDLFKYSKILNVIIKVLRLINK